MNTKTIFQSLLTLSLVAASLYLLTSTSVMMVELGKAMMLLSVISLLPLAHASAKAQLSDKTYESTQVHELTQDASKQKVA